MAVELSELNSQPGKIIEFTPRHSIKEPSLAPLPRPPLVDFYLNPSEFTQADSTIQRERMRLAYLDRANEDPTLLSPERQRDEEEEFMWTNKENDLPLEADVWRAADFENENFKLRRLFFKK